MRLVQQHNLEADRGVHTYRLGMNEYADMVCFRGTATVNALYNGIRYNSKFRYNVNSACTKNQRIVYFFRLQSHVIL